MSDPLTNPPVAHTNKHLGNDPFDDPMALYASEQQKGKPTAVPHDPGKNDVTDTNNDTTNDGAENRPKKKRRGNVKKFQTRKQGRTRHREKEAKNPGPVWRPGIPAAGTMPKYGGKISNAPQESDFGLNTPIGLRHNRLCMQGEIETVGNPEELDQDKVSPLPGELPPVTEMELQYTVKELPHGALLKEDLCLYYMRPPSTITSWTRLVEKTDTDGTKRLVTGKVNMQFVWDEERGERRYLTRRRGDSAALRGPKEGKLWYFPHASGFWLDEDKGTTHRFWFHDILLPPHGVFYAEQR